MGGGGNGAGERRERQEIQSQEDGPTVVNLDETGDRAGVRQ